MIVRDERERESESETIEKRGREPEDMVQTDDPALVRGV